VIDGKWNAFGLQVQSVLPAGQHSFISNDALLSYGKQQGNLWNHYQEDNFAVYKPRRDPFRSRLTRMQLADDCPAAMAKKSRLVRVDQIQQNPFHRAESRDSMQKRLNAMKDHAAWANHWGSQHGHDAAHIAAVARLLSEGVRHWPWATELHPNAHRHFFECITPETWWIMMTADDDYEQQLYLILAQKVHECYFEVWNPDHTAAKALEFLREAEYTVNEIMNLNIRRALLEPRSAAPGYRMYDRATPWPE